MVDGVDGDADVAACGDEIAVYDGTAGGDFAREGLSDGGRHAHGFVNTGAEVAALIQFRAIVLDF
jgi:hypothetical protein